MLHLTFSEKQDLMVLISTEISRLNKELSALPKKSTNINVLDKKQSIPALVTRHQQLLDKLNLIPA